jgi:hypothetical protein
MVTKFPLLFATALSLVQLARGAILTSPEQVAASKQYDFIIVGGEDPNQIILFRGRPDSHAFKPEPSVFNHMFRRNEHTLTSSFCSF